MDHLMSELFKVTRNTWTFFRVENVNESLEVPLMRTTAIVKKPNETLNPVRDVNNNGYFV